jgi:Homing endonuclease associated repeat
MRRDCSGKLAEFVERSKLLADMARRRSRKRAPVRIDEAELAAFRAGLRRRYTDEEILDELRAAAERMGRSPTMREFAQDPEARVHPQTVIEHFGTWNAAKRAAGLFPRRFLTRDELLEQLRLLGDELGRTPTARDLAARPRSLPSASLYAHTFGSLGNALREAGFEVLQGEERLERAITQGAALALGLGRLPKMADWAEARRADRTLLSEWQVYRLLDVPSGAWTAFQYLVRERLRDEGVDVLPDGSLTL